MQFTKSNSAFVRAFYKGSGSSALPVRTITAIFAPIGLVDLQQTQRGAPLTPLGKTKSFQKNYSVR